MPSVLPRYRRFDYSRRSSFEVAGDVMLGAFCHIRIGIDLCRIERFRIPFWRKLSEKSRLLVNRVYSLEIVRERPVPRVRASEMLTYKCDPLLESCFDFQSCRSALSLFPFAERTALTTAAFVFVQNCLVGMTTRNHMQIARRVSG